MSTLLTRGKVRELYDLGDDLLMVASDRISTYDVVHPTPIPDKGKVLTGLSVVWFDLTEGIVPNHLVSATDGVPDEFRGRGLRVRKLRMLPVECVVRGYITGSGWKDYQATGKVSGIELPPGLRESERLPTPAFTPSTKADEGDEVLTPDSSRYWPADGYQAGQGQPSFDKQYVRDWAAGSGWDKAPPAPALPEHVVERTRALYVDAYERITGEPFTAWLERSS